MTRARHRAKRAGTALAALVLFALCACTLPPRAEVARRLDSIHAESVRGRVEGLVAVGPRSGADPAATEKALEWIAAALRNAGYEPVREIFRAETPVVSRGVEERNGKRVNVAHFTYVEGDHVNLIAERRGTDRPDIVIELGAHYDTVPGSPGADDNASGVAVLLEVARVLADAELERTVRFCFFGLEEDGLLGARAHAELLRERKRDRTEYPYGALVLDMVAYASKEEGSQDSPIRIPFLFDPPTTGDFILLASNFPSGWIASEFESCADRYAPDLDVFAIKRLAGLHPDAKRGDHYAYWERGLRAITLVDTAELRNPHYHAPSDLSQTLDYEFLARIARASGAWVMERARLVAE